MGLNKRKYLNKIGYVFTVKNGHKSREKLYRKEDIKAISSVSKLTTPLDGNYILITNAYRQNVS